MNYTSNSNNDPHISGKNNRKQRLSRALRKNLRRRKEQVNSQDSNPPKRQKLIKPTKE